MSLPEPDHVCLSSIDWEYLWQGPQEVMTRFARSGARVLYVDNTGIRRPRLSEWRRILSRLRAWGSGPGGRAVAPVPGITVLSPLVLPFPWSRAARLVNRAVFADRLPGRAEKLGLARPVVWTFLPTPLALDVLRAFRLSRTLAAYYCVADFEPVSDDPAATRAGEDELLREVDVVFAGGRVLERRFAGRHERVILAPYSVGDAFFSGTTRTPADLAAIPAPRVGYVGGLHRHIDVELLGRVIAAMPAANFVFVGPQISPDWGFERYPNAHFLGRRPHADLPAYVDGFDVCLVPYQRSRFTETVWPTKLHEYLARGKPVVSTPLPEVELMGYEPGIVRLAATPDELGNAILAALAEGAAGADRRRLAAHEYSWERTVRRMGDAIAEIRTAPARRAGEARS